MKTKIILKKLLATIMLMLLTVASSLTVVACGKNKTKQESENTNSVIVNAINEINYNKQIIWNTKVETLEKAINASFISERLSSKVQKIFRSDLFIKKQITNENGIKLSDIDLKSEILNAKIIYDYGDFKNQITNLMINIIVADRQIVNAINAKRYERKIVKNMGVDVLIRLISVEYIVHDWVERYGWSPTIVDKIIDEFHHFFKLNKIINAKGVELVDDDLKTETTIVGEFNYDYGAIKNQSAKLVVKVVKWWILT